MAKEQKNVGTEEYASPGRAIYHLPEDPRRQSATIRGVEPAPLLKRPLDDLQKREQARRKQAMRVAYGDFYSVIEAGSSETGELAQEENGTLNRILEHCRDYLCRKWNVSASDLIFHTPVTPTEERKPLLTLEELFFERLHPALEPQRGAYFKFLNTIMTRVERCPEELLQTVRPYFSIKKTDEISPEKLENLLKKNYPSQPFLDLPTAKHVLEQFCLTAKPEDFWIALALGKTLCSQFTPDNARQVREGFFQTNSEDLLNIRELLYPILQRKIIPARTLVTLTTYARVRGISEATFSELFSTYQDNEPASQAEEPIIFCGSEEEQRRYRNKIGDFFRVILTDGSQLRKCLGYSSFVVVASEAFLTAFSAYSQHLKEESEGKQRQFIMGVDIEDSEHVLRMINVGLGKRSQLEEKRDKYRKSLTRI